MSILGILLHIFFILLAFSRQKIQKKRHEKNLYISIGNVRQVANTETDGEMP